MSALSQLQDLFWQAVRQDPAPPEIDAAFVSRGRLSGRARMGIYRTAYWVRQVAGLREIFPSVVEILGDGPFAREASRFIGQHPSTSWALEYLGEGFADWLTSRWPGDVALAAALDWARWKVFVAPDVAPVAANGINVQELPSMRMQVGAHVELIPVVELAVWRSGFSVLQLQMSPAEAKALAAAKSSLSFSGFCELLAAGDESQASLERVLSVFRAWLNRGWLISLE